MIPILIAFRIRRGPSRSFCDMPPPIICLRLGDLGGSSRLPFFLPVFSSSGSPFNVRCTNFNTKSCIGWSVDPSVYKYLENIETIVPIMKVLDTGSLWKSIVSKSETWIAMFKLNFGWAERFLKKSKSKMLKEKGTLSDCIYFKSGSINRLIGMDGTPRNKFVKLDK